MGLLLEHTDSNAVIPALFHSYSNVLSHESDLNHKNEYFLYLRSSKAYSWNQKIY